MSWWVVQTREGVLVTQIKPPDGMGVRFDCERDAREFVIRSQA